MGSKKAARRASDAATPPKSLQVDLEVHPLPTEPLNDDSAFFASERLVTDFQDAQPFRHAVICEFLKKDFAARLREEFISNFDVKFKETDLFKFHQTKDISAILASPEASQKLPYLAKLVGRIYSEDFRTLLSQKFQLGNLADRVDMAAQAYTEGCHLLCHDDVISTRKLTFVLYLADPTEEPWRAEEGGGMEMYSEESPIPVFEILPDFNVALFFAVEPGKSYHAVREISGQRTRLSLQGWFHAPCLEETFGFERREEASLQQLLARPNTNDLAAVAEPISSTGIGSETMRAALAPWVHPQYLEDAALEQLQTHFAENSEVQLSDFLLPERAQRLLELLQAADAAEEPSSYSAGCLDGWVLQGPAHLRRYLVYTGKEACEQPSKRSRTDEVEASPQRQLGEALQEIEQGLLLQAAFRALLERVTNLRLPGCEQTEVRRFRRGLDYTVATLRGLRAEAKVDVCLMAVWGGASPRQPKRKLRKKGAKRKAKATKGSTQTLWATEEVGGFESYIEVEEDENDEKAEVYRDDDDEGPLLNIPATHNALSIVMRDPGTLSFVKFVSRAAPSARCDLRLSFGIDPSSLASDQEES